MNHPNSTPANYATSPAPSFPEAVTEPAQTVLTDRSNLTPRRNLEKQKDEYSRMKIAELQEQAIRARKELAQRESQHAKEQTQLLSRIEILSMDNAELNQRQNQLAKLNNALELAVGSRQSAEQQETQRKSSEIRELEEENSKKNKLIRQLRQNNQDMQRAMNTLKAQLNSRQQQSREEMQKNASKMRQKQRQLQELVAANQRLEQERSDQMLRVEREVRRLPFNEDILNVIFRALQVQPEEVEWAESPISHRTVNERDFSRSQLQNTGGTSFIGALAEAVESEYSEDEEVLLCEICQRVFRQEEFVAHMDHCNQVSQLKRKRSQLEASLERMPTPNMNKWQSCKPSDRSMRASNGHGKRGFGWSGRESSELKSRQTMGGRRGDEGRLF